MNLCPTCGRDTWQYNYNTITCKNGHRTSVEFDSKVVEPSARVRLHVPGRSLSVVPFVAALPGIVALVLHFA